MSDPTEFIVTLAPGTSAAGVSDLLTEHGFETTAILGDLSMIVGRADAKTATAVAAVPGVVAVEPSQTITLPPDGPE